MKRVRQRSAESRGFSPSALVSILPQGIKVGWVVKVINTNNEVKIQFPNSVAAESLLVFRDYSLYM